MRTQKRFTNTYIDALKAKEARYEVSESGGLKLRITPNQTKTWVYVYRHHGRLRRLTIGNYPYKSLAEARAFATSARVIRSKGIDPATQAQRNKIAILTTPTIRQLVDDYIELYAKQKKKTWATDKLMLEKDIIPKFGHCKVNEIKRIDIIQQIEKIAKRAPIIANRTLEVTRKMFNWAIERDILSVNPCWNISRPSKENQRDRVLNKDEIQKLWNILGCSKHQVSEKSKAYWPSQQIRLAIKFSLATGQRRSEIAGAKMSEFNLTERIWTIPKTRTKNEITQQLPISTITMQILSEIKALSPDSKWLLPSPRNNDSIDPNALTRAVSRIRDELKFPGWTLHDLRRTAASQMAALSVSRFIIARILNHTDNSVTAIYDRHGYEKEKREALQLWSKAIFLIVQPG